MSTTGHAPSAPVSGGFNERMKSALLLAPVAIFVVFWGGKLFGLMAAAIAAIAVFEWVRMVEKDGKFFLPWVGAGVAGVAAIASALLLDPVLSLWFHAGMAFLMFAAVYAADGKDGLRDAFGVIYIGFSVSVMLWLRLAGNDGLYHFLMLMLLIWASDSFAYFAGRAIGGPKLAPVISPKKTWAGFFGSSFGAALVVGAMGCPWLVETLHVTPLASWQVLAAVGFVLAMFGQAGDLFISLLKRHYGVKDTGALIPGHGGILDRIDALLLVAPLFGMFVLLAGGGGGGR